MSLLSRLRALRDSTLGKNLMSLYGVHFVTYLLPLLTVPYLARVLGPTSWGVVAFAQSISLYATLVVEYGFNLSATREVARHRGNRDRLASILAEVLGAKIVLALLVMLAIAIAQPWIPHLRDHPAMLWIAVVGALARAFNVLWFFQGLEQMSVIALVNVLTDAVGVAGIFLLVHTPDHGIRVLALQAAAAITSFLLGTRFAYREISFEWPTLSGTRQALRMGLSLFVFRSAVSLYTVANVVILGVLAPVQSVGYFSGAYKIATAVGGLADPAIRAIYPRASHLSRSSFADAARLARISVIVASLGGSLAGLGLFLLAPLIVDLLLGPDFQAAIPVLRMLALLPLLIALSKVLGIQWMLPLGMDRQFNSIIIAAGALNIAISSILAQRYDELGMACAVVAAEAFVTGAMFVVLRWRRADPFTSVRPAVSESL